MPRPKLRTPELKDRVRDAALDVLVRDGIAGFTTRKVADAAGTSTKAVYELFGDRSGLVRDLFFEGFRQLGHDLAAVRPDEDPRAHLVATLATVRRFVRVRPPLAELMFSTPFADFEPGPHELDAGASVREVLVARAGAYLRQIGSAADATDVAHVVLALVQGLALQESAGWLGTSRASVDRRWRLAVDTLLDGLAARDTSGR